MDDGRLFSAGVIGGVAFSVLSAVLRPAGIHIDLELWLGTVAIGPGSAAWVVGFFWHLTLSGFTAMLYGRAFLALGRADAATGLRVAVVHMSINGALLGFLPWLHPRIPELVAAPGFFLGAQGLAGMAAFVVVHLAYGAVVGAFARAASSRVVVPRAPRVLHGSARAAREVAAH